MEKTCPRCGKVMEVSAEELSMRRGVVVCPQCLAVWDMDGNLHSEEPHYATRQVQDPDPDAEQQQSAATDEVAPGYKFCPECGKPLPGGVKFCPYCGQHLAMPHPAQLLEEDPEPQPEAQSEPEAAQPTSKSPQPRRKSERRQAPTARWSPVFPSVHYRMNKWGTGPASVGARLLGYLVIAAELALLAYIIYQGSLIS